MANSNPMGRVPDDATARIQTLCNLMGQRRTAEALGIAPLTLCKVLLGAEVHAYAAEKVQRNLVKLESMRGAVNGTTK